MPYPTDMSREQRRRADSTRNYAASGEHPEEVISETPRTALGYSVQIVRVTFDSAGKRIRIKLLQDGNFVRHLDLTEPLAKSLGALLVDL